MEVFKEDISDEEWVAEMWNIVDKLSKDHPVYLMKHKKSGKERVLKGELVEVAGKKDTNRRFVFETRIKSFLKKDKIISPKTKKSIDIIGRILDEMLGINVTMHIETLTKGQEKGLRKKFKRLPGWQRANLSDKWDKVHHRKITEALEYERMENNLDVKLASNKYVWYVMDRVCPLVDMNMPQGETIEDKKKREFTMFQNLGVHIKPGMPMTGKEKFCFESLGKTIACDMFFGNQDRFGKLPDIDQWKYPVNSGNIFMTKGPKSGLINFLPLDIFDTQTSYAIHLGVPVIAGAEAQKEYTIGGQCAKQNMLNFANSDVIMTHAIAIQAVSKLRNCFIYSGIVDLMGKNAVKATVKGINAARNALMKNKNEILKLAKTYGLIGLQDRVKMISYKTK